jgi:hypothetical protein
MKALWNALIARMVYWLTPKPPVVLSAPIVQVQAPDPPLKPGVCQCSHQRCAHISGKGKCYAQYKPHSKDNDTDGWLHCGCQIYIPKKDDPPDAQPETPAPSADELERMFS